MNFYYAEQHRQLLVDCPPKDYKSLNIIAYRWIFDQDEAQNYQSQFEKDMNRKKPPRRYNDMSDLEKCDRMALSMFTSKESAEKQFNFFKIVQQMGENAYLYLGKYVAMGMLEETDGVNEIPANKFGHFNHHPVAGFNYHKQFKIISKL